MIVVFLLVILAGLGATAVLAIGVAAMFVGGH